MDFSERGGIYKPIRHLFVTPLYERTLETCWHLSSYNVQVTLMAELLQRQQRNQLPSTVTAEDMIELLLDQSKNSWRVRLWEFEVEGNNNVEFIHLLKLVWKVNTSLKTRDIEFEARRLLSLPETIPPQHHRFLWQVSMYARILLEKHRQGPRLKLLCPHDVVMEVVPKVVQSFWLLIPATNVNRPSRQLSQMAVGVTKAVKDCVSVSVSLLLPVSFSRSIRDNMVRSIQKKVRHNYTEDVLLNMLYTCAPEVLSTIRDVTVAEICELFQPDEPSLEEEEQTSSATSDYVVHPTLPCTLSLPAELPLLTSAKDEENISEESSRETLSAVVSDPAARLTPPNEAAVAIAEQEDETEADEAEAETKGFFNWLRQTLCCCVQPED